ncbi:hypothetical protein [Herpetosiphon llansteffanensis]|uniref:hypothetical protein n=1 Tax=Herpetosiphon llansteffanensis TaxID=2094568 RepID=UPI000D7C9819|nr:hypothetical protein [Herpetosiphon llansteffanensis]
MMQAWVDGTVIRGHGVASGQASDSPYPAGTIAMQQPYFAALGLDLSGLQLATINFDIQPAQWRLLQADYSFRAVRWTDLHPPEDFSFIRCQLLWQAQTYAGYIYYPHPATKMQHFQSPSMLELLLPWIATISYGARARLIYRAEQIQIEPAALL